MLPAWSIRWLEGSSKCQHSQKWLLQGIFIALAIFFITLFYFKLFLYFHHITKVLLRLQPGQSPQEQPVHSPHTSPAHGTEGSTNTCGVHAASARPAAAHTAQACTRHAEATRTHVHHHTHAMHAHRMRTPPAHIEPPLHTHTHSAIHHSALGCRALRTSPRAAWSIPASVPGTTCFDRAELCQAAQGEK